MMNLNDSLLYVGVDLHVFFECSALAMLGRCQSSLRTAFRHEKQPSSNNQVQSLSFLGSRNDRDWGRVPTIHCVSTTISHRQVCTLEVVTMTTVANADFAAEASQSWASTLKDLDPPSFLEKFWSKSTRSDGRLFSICRRTRLTRGILKLRTAGSSLIQLGNTQIVCGISLLVGQPSIPDNGDLVVTRADSPDFSLPLQSILTEMLDLSCLAIGEAQAWRLEVTLQVLEDDGNLNDACLLAAVAALTDTRLPPTQRNPQTERIEIIESSEENGRSLKFNYIPVPLTLGIYFGKDKKTTFLLADPTVEEEALLQGQLTVVVKLDDKSTEERHNILHVQHSCAPPGLKREDLAVAAHMAYGRDKEVRELLS